MLKYYLQTGETDYMSNKFQSLIEKEKNKLTSMLTELKTRKLTPAQQKKMEKIEMLFKSVSSKEKHSASEKQSIKSQVSKLNGK